ncbi:winged helix-turn-helix transcriptional regulator [Pseudomonas sp. No.21]|uniref:winged helix-turn-helix transcriptional regulator n=1 Tax=Pseudomonas TaxID=286 RepID=UPI000DA7C258|nr:MULTISPECIES: helix-turn-helix domain-containing protein [Pseudomonas]MDW3713878.1 helix-turn-helix domain-containing protein [Pseudomonas sp. 2023EL-01195]PZE10143.1 transcriptional regulator [Pseudomonas sp. 57B-090624]GJN49224.1 transcriptional regulator [Pseudomonas tohonis]
MTLPLPGKPVRGSATGRPIMALLDLLGRRWSLRILWELRQGPATFRELQARCEGLSPSVLNTRMGELRQALLIDTGDAGYRLSEDGEELVRRCLPLAEWAETWAERLPPPSDA